MKKSQWNGYERYDFTVEDREALMIVPKVSAEGNPWIWRAEFFDAFPQVDLAMVEKGWHLAYYKVSDMYGCPEAIQLMHGFHDFVEKKFHLTSRTVLFGFSRGGLYSFNYAAEYPDKVAALYLDAPVLDIRSWPGGFGEAQRSEQEWRECLEVYGLTEDTAVHFKGNPINKINQVAKAAIPIIIVFGENDTAAIFGENSEILCNEYKKLGGVIKVIGKPGVGHHPHSLEDPTPVVQFLLEKSLK